MARISLAAIATKIASLFADNENGEIKEADLREVSTDLKDSFTHLDEFEDHEDDTNNPHEVTKAQVGLGSVDNTADLDKPVSNEQQVALNLKANIRREQLTGGEVVFTRDAIYGTIAAPITGNITTDLTGAQLGVELIVIHNDGGEPSYPAAFKKLNSSQAYDVGAVNYIFLKYINPTLVLVRIDNEV